MASHQRRRRRSLLASRCVIKLGPTVRRSRLPPQIGHLDCGFITCCFPPSRCCTPRARNPMKIVVPVKYVPEPTAAWRFADDLTLDRDGVEGRLSELDEYAVEQAVRLTEAGLDAEIVALTVGPAKATDALRKALAMGATSGIHVLDDAMHGSDAMSTSLVLAAAIEQAGFDLVVTGMSSTDAEMSVIPAMVAERLGAAQVTFASALSVDAAAGTVTIRRDSDTASAQVQ